MRFRPLEWVQRRRRAGGVREALRGMRQSIPLPFPHADEAYLVGGAVRDLLLGREPFDFDWLVRDPRGEAERAAVKLGGSVFALDETRGHWRVAAGGILRDYIGLRGDLHANLLERDFTLNALAWSADGVLHDPAGGRADLEAGVVRMVARENLVADPVRGLRGVRFAATLGFVLEAATRAAIREVARAQRRGDVRVGAPERVGEELSRLMDSPRAAEGFRLADELELLDVHLPELAEGRGVEQGGLHHLSVLEHNIEALRQLLLGFPDAPVALRWAALLHDVGKPRTREVDAGTGLASFHGHDRIGSEITRSRLRALRLPGATVDAAAALVKRHMLPLPRGDREARRFVHRRRELLPDLLKLMIADREAARGPQASEAGRRAYRLALAQVVQVLEETPEEPPLVDGRAVMDALGLEPGPRVGEALRLVREAQAVGDVRSREEALELVRGYARSRGWSGDAGDVGASRP